jgi:hypothetical protein
VSRGEDVEVTRRQVVTQGGAITGKTLDPQDVIDTQLRNSLSQKLAIIAVAN